MSDTLRHEPKLLHESPALERATNEIPEGEPDLGDQVRQNADDAPAVPDHEAEHSNRVERAQNVVPSDGGRAEMGLRRSSREDAEAHDGAALEQAGAAPSCSLFSIAAAAEGLFIDMNRSSSRSRKPNAGTAPFTP